ncbi:MAG: MarR family transcriptional regulator [Chlorobi bacterium]|nr:MarR family transcriptional regulator [Chlorobiota bacterium]
MEKKEQILNAFKESGQPLKTAEIAEKTGIDSKEIGKLIKELKSDDKIYSPKRCFYDIKK